MNTKTIPTPTGASATGLRTLVAGLCLGAILAGCATQPGSSPAAGAASAPASAPANQPVPQTKLPTNTVTPSVLVAGRKPRDVVDEIVKYRTGKGMRVLNRSNTKVEFSAMVTGAKTPTEARMVYQLAPVSGGLRVSARVFQVSYPGTGHEEVSEITGVVADKLNQELSGYTQPANPH